MATALAVARYYLNGMYLEIKTGRLRFVATDGHRLALCTAPGELSADDKSVIVPRKGILELARLLDGDGSVTLTVGSNHIRAATDQFTFTSKLVDRLFSVLEFSAGSFSDLLFDPNYFPLGARGQVPKH